MRKLVPFLVLAIFLGTGSSALARHLAHHRSCPAHASARAHRGCRIRLQQRHRLTHAGSQVQRPASAGGGGGTASVHCDLFASPAGSDSTGNGRIASPFQTVAQLDVSLRPGQTGCLRAGSYGSTSTWHKIYTNGAPSAQITITSYPGESSTTSTTSSRLPRSAVTGSASASGATPTTRSSATARSTMSASAWPTTI